MEALRLRGANAGDSPRAATGGGLGRAIGFIGDSVTAAGRTTPTGAALVKAELTAGVAGEGVRLAPEGRESEDQSESLASTSSSEFDSSAELLGRSAAEADEEEEVDLGFGFCPLEKFMHATTDSWGPGVRLRSFIGDLVSAVVFVR